MEEFYINFYDKQFIHLFQFFVFIIYWQYIFIYLYII
jgi:hypothetical protein